jgi:hypothetical protein
MLASAVYQGVISLRTVAYVQAPHPLHTESILATTAIMVVCAGIQHNRMFQRLMRVLQFVSSTVSLGLFSARLHRILRTIQKASISNGAVEGILAAAVAYTLSSMILRLCLKNGGPKWLRLLTILLDLLFVGGFIAVAVLTRPNGGTSGPCNNRIRPYIPDRTNCNLPWGTFILAIVST